MLADQPATNDAIAGQSALSGATMPSLTELTELTSRLAASATMAETLTGDPDVAMSLRALRRDLCDAIDALGARSRELDALVARAQRHQVETARRSGEPLRLNIGPGPEPLAGWTNVDVAGGDVLADLRRPLPFPDSSVSHIYCSHVLEHLRNPDESHGFLRECRRVLHRGGKLRVVVPDIGAYLRAALEHDEAFWETHQETWTWSRVDANRLDQTLRYAGAGPNPGDVFGHQHGYDEDSLVQTLATAGFGPISPNGFQQSKDPIMRIDDHSAVAHAHHRGRPFSLFVDAYALF